MSRHARRLLSLLLLLATPSLVWAGSDKDGAATESSAPVAGEAVAEQDVESEDGAIPFRLFTRRDVGLRLRLNTGMRVPRLEPTFSPRTADYFGYDRHQGPLYAVAVSIATLSADDERDSFKGQEFRDFEEDLAAGIDFLVRSEHDQLRLTGRHLNLDDRDVDLEWRRFGVLKTRLHYNRIPHNFAFGARSLYSGVGTGRLTIDDSARQTLQGSTSLVDAAERARQLVAGAPAIDIGLARDRLGLKLDITAFDPLAIEISIDDESREGARPWAGSFGYANLVEIPWGVDYQTRNVKIGLEYAAGSTLVRGSWRHSSFDNEIDAVLFDNPWRTVDSGLGRPIFTSFQSGPATGLIDLYPSNEQEELTLTAVKSQLPGRSTLTATVSWNRMEQDDPLLPFTTNTALVPGGPGNPPFVASDPANLPAARADAEIESRLVHLRWSSRPTDAVEIKAHFRDSQVDNNTAQIFIPGFGLEDQGWRNFFPTGGSFTNLPIAQSTTSYGADLSYRTKSRTKLALSYTREEIDRKFREVDESVEDRFKLQVDAKPASWMDLRASYLISEKEAKSYVFDQFFSSQGIEFIPALPFLLRFDQASRDRDRLQLMANFYPSEAWILSAQVIVGADDFPESQFGVLGDDHEIYSLDVSYAANERLSFFGSYSIEEYDVLLRGREWRPFGPGDPFRTETGFDSASNWTARSIDQIYTVTAGLELSLIPDKLRLDVAFSRSDSDGKILYDSQVGALDANPYDPTDFSRVDDVAFYNLNPELDFTLNDRVSLVLSYLREKYDILDFNKPGFQLVPVTSSGEFNGGLFMGTLPVDFNLEVLALKLELSY